MLDTSKVKLKKNGEEIEDWLITQFAERLQCNPDDIEIHEPFDHYELESSQLLILMTKLEQWLGQELNPVLVFNYPTIALLAHRLAE